ncbi:MAG: EamA family transporter [Cyanobacteria bacterium J06648_16]
MSDWLCQYSRGSAMFGRIGAMALAVLGVTLYHTAQKLQPATVSLFWLLTVAYLVAGLLSLSICLLVPEMKPDAFVLPKESVLLGIAILVIEVGYLLVYRSGWNVGTAGAMSNTAAVLVLLPIGLIFFREKLAPTQLLGLLLCSTGLFLTAR